MIMTTGCQKKQPDTLPVSPAEKNVDQSEMKDIDKTTDTASANKGADTNKDKNKSIVEISKPKTYLEQVEELTKKKEQVAEGVALYKILITKLPKGDKARETLLDYIMAESLTMVQSKDRQKIQIGLDAGFALNNIEAGNFYVQNRIIYAYTSFAKLERAAGNLDKAQAYTEKALAYRFDAEAMRLRLEILMDKAKQFIATKQYDEAKKLLKEIIEISDMSPGVLNEEKAAAEALLTKIQDK